ncbi:MAG: class I SAM-dependent methyltransferase [Spirochaetales bacterium]|nr:class I SAM-dependent methyltransferase [Spirochaetales bacterium]
MKLSDVSKTAIATLRGRVIESRREHPLIADPMAEYCLERFKTLVPDAEGEGIFTRRLSRRLTIHLAIRARKYDSIADEFIKKNPMCTVVNLGCGFDTRYWRIDNRKCRYFDLDLPEVVEIKRELLKDKLGYQLIGRSVLDPSWIRTVTEKSDSNILLLAEGLFMYLDKSDVVNLFRIFSESFTHSQIALEVVTEKYTSGMWKKIVTAKIKQQLGLEAGSSYNFGIKNAAEIETYGAGIKIAGEWSYVEDPDTRPRILKYLGISRTQWTVIAAINGENA